MSGIKRKQTRRSSKIFRQPVEELAQITEEEEKQVTKDEPKKSPKNINKNAKKLRQTKNFVEEIKSPIP